MFRIFCILTESVIKFAVPVRPYFFLLFSSLNLVNALGIAIILFQYFQEKLVGTPWYHTFENYFAVAAMGPNLLMFFLNTLFKHK